MTIAKELPTYYSICSVNTYNSVFVATFTSGAVCDSYARTSILGAPSETSYSNCSVASYCMPFNNPFSGSLEGFSLTAITAQQFSAAKLEFPTAEDCINAQLHGAFYCGGGSNPVCRDTFLTLNSCNDGSSGFSIPAGEILTFDLLP